MIALNWGEREVDAGTAADGRQHRADHHRGTVGPVPQGGVPAPTAHRHGGVVRRRRGHRVLHVRRGGASILGVALCVVAAVTWAVATIVQKAGAEARLRAPGDHLRLPHRRGHLSAVRRATRRPGRRGAALGHAERGLSGRFPTALAHDMGLRPRPDDRRQDGRHHLRGSGHRDPDGLGLLGRPRPGSPWSAAALCLAGVAVSRRRTA